MHIICNETAEFHTAEGHDSCDITTPKVDQILAETVNTEQDDVGFGDGTILHIPDSVLQSLDVTGQTLNVDGNDDPNPPHVAIDKADATEIQVEDASYPKATKADFANLENSLGFTDDQSITKFESYDHKLGVVPEWDPNSCDIATPEVDHDILAETRLQKTVSILK